MGGEEKRPPLIITKGIYTSLLTSAGLTVNQKRTAIRLIMRSYPGMMEGTVVHRVRLRRAKKASLSEGDIQEVGQAIDAMDGHRLRNNTNMDSQSSTVHL